MQSTMRAAGAASNRTVRLDGEKLRLARQNLGLSREKLVEKAQGGAHSLSLATLKRAEGGEGVYVNTASSLAELLVVPLTSLLAPTAAGGGDGTTGADRGEPGIVSQPTIAVMPFRISDPEATAFAEGLAEDLITRISRWWFPVIARTSTLGPAVIGSQASLPELGAKYRIEGSVQRTHDDLRITAQLVEATTGVILWRRDYERAFERVFELQNELTTAIVSGLSPRLLDAEIRALEQRDPLDLEAWQVALRGAWHFYRRTARDNREARSLLEQALRQDQHLPLAWYALALSHQQDLVNQWCDDPGASLHSLASVCQDFQRLHPTEAGSQVTAAYLDVYRGQRGSAMARLTEAIELDPNACLAYSLYGQTLAMGREPDRSLEQFEIALRLSPRDTERWSIHTGIALAHFVAERYEETSAAALQASRLRPEMAFPYGVLASAQAQLGNLVEARQALETMLQVAPGTTLNGVMSIMGSTDEDIGKRYLSGLRQAGLPG